MLSETTPKQNTSEQISLFFYGTLKVGCPNHDRYCRGAVNIRPATVVGRLYSLGSFPALEVPNHTILAHGTADPAADVATQARFEGKVLQHPEPQASAHTRPDWGLVCGELMTFGDPADRLPRLDQLEGFYPGEHSLYQRVLLAVATSNGTVPAWVYVTNPDSLVPQKRQIRSWPL